LRLWAAAGVLLAATVRRVDVLLPAASSPSHFAWVVEPRLAQAFIGAGYVFRTASSSCSSSSPATGCTSAGRLWGNLAFTGTLLLATLWHADEMNWRFLVAHLWIVFYTFEPITMIFSAPLDRRGRTAHLSPAAPSCPGSAAS
jgi:hypothetical protein